MATYENLLREGTAASPGPGSIMIGRGHKKASDEELLVSYKETGSVWKTATRFSMCGQSVHERLSRLGVILQGSTWTKPEDDLLVKCYKEYSKDGTFISHSMVATGRSYAAVACRANELKLTIKTRSKSVGHRSAMSENIKSWHSQNTHPKGMLGKEHSAETKSIIAEKSHAMALRYTNEQWNQRSEKMVATKMKNGTLNTMRFITNPYSHTTSGKRSDLGGKFFRSKTEANYARVLNFMGIIWEYEPRDFYFEGIRRGCVSYTPDFYLPIEDRWIEVKGWLDKKGTTKLNRFKKYYPVEFSKLTIITQSKKTYDMCLEMGMKAERYEIIRNQVSGLIPGWEK